MSVINSVKSVLVLAKLIHESMQLQNLSLNILNCTILRVKLPINLFTFCFCFHGYNLRYKAIPSPIYTDYPKKTLQ